MSMENDKTNSDKIYRILRSVLFLIFILTITALATTAPKPQTQTDCYASMTQTTYQNDWLTYCELGG